MNFQDFIKVQNQSPFQDKAKEMNYYMTHFYDEDSQQSIKLQADSRSTFTLNQIVEQLQAMFDLRVTGIQTIMAHARDDLYISSSVNLLELRAKVNKRKIELKRNHAKNREKVEGKKQYYVICSNDADVSEDIQTEIKKKRNRVSAQVSRDRKKVKIQELQIENQKLHQEAERVKLENEKLKRQLEEFNKFETRKVEVSKPQKNKFLSLLIMLGMLFLMSILKEKPKINELRLVEKMKGSFDFGIRGEPESWISDGERILMDIQGYDEAIFQDKESMSLIMSELEEMKVLNELPISLKRSLAVIESSMTQ